MRIGLDFDNTLAGYDRVFVEAALDMGLLSKGFSGGKGDVRDALRAKPDGEIEWQRLQGQVYGRYMPLAELIPGVAAFLDAAAGAGARVMIVSHKTEFGHFDAARIDLREAARAWMEAQGFFDRFGVNRADVHFLPTRREKVLRIAELAPDVFVDDLPEVFLEHDFPPHTRRLLFSDRPLSGPWEALCDWAAIRQAVFGHE